jgi:hypothetical protein
LAAYKQAGYLFCVAWYYSLTPYSTVLLEKLIDFQLVKKIPAFYGTQMFITAFTTALPDITGTKTLSSYNTRTV